MCLEDVHLILEEGCDLNMDRCVFSLSIINTKINNQNIIINPRTIAYYLQFV